MKRIFVCAFLLLATSARSESLYQWVATVEETSMVCRPMCDTTTTKKHVEIPDVSTDVQLPVTAWPCFVTDNSRFRTLPGDWGTGKRRSISCIAGFQKRLVDISVVCVKPSESVLGDDYKRSGWITVSNGDEPVAVVRLTCYGNPDK
ncbi:MAG TPA: hypothetical protein VF678_01500 [bacterium]